MWRFLPVNKHLQGRLTLICLNPQSYCQPLTLQVPIFPFSCSGPCVRDKFLAMIIVFIIVAAVASAQTGNGKLNEDEKMELIEKMENFKSRLNVFQPAMEGIHSFA